MSAHGGLNWPGSGGIHDAPMGHAAGPGGVGGETPGISGGSTEGLHGSAVLAAQRSGIKAEIDKDPSLRNELAGMMKLEGSPQQTMESLANRTVMMNQWRKSRGLKPLSVRQMLHSGFYGPINRGQLPGAIANLARNPHEMARMNKAIDSVLGGSNTIRGFTDQGMPSDPNGAWGMRHGHLMKGGNLFTDWGGGPGHDFATRFREEQQRAVAGEGAHDTASIPLPQARPHLDKELQKKKELEKPIQIRYERDPGEAQFRRASMRAQLDREVRDARWKSFSDVGAA